MGPNSELHFSSLKIRRKHFLSSYFSTSGSTWERTEESTSIINLFAIEFVREKVHEQKKSNREAGLILGLDEKKHLSELSTTRREYKLCLPWIGNGYVIRSIDGCHCFGYLHPAIPVYSLHIAKIWCYFGVASLGAE
nr:uncharacterized protein LOC103418455 [Malus domestica]XP_028944211.1 uncharacterized protein LOC103418455 [Malus domestica]XP_028944212.1 uncharacterized protein LOC103418455 [Malus domestica]XP_028944213.1 uncharacterized protein LOC103418455 [Malus domestica]